MPVGLYEQKGDKKWKGKLKKDPAENLNQVIFYLFYGRHDYWSIFCCTMTVWTIYKNNLSRLKSNVCGYGYLFVLIFSVQLHPADCLEIIETHLKVSVV